MKIDRLRNQVCFYDPNWHEVDRRYQWDSIDSMRERFVAYPEVERTGADWAVISLTKRGWYFALKEPLD